MWSGTCRLFAGHGILVLVLATGAVALQAARPWSSTEFKGEGVCLFATNGFVPAPGSQAVINQTVETLIARHQETFGFRRHAGFRLRMRVFNTVQEFRNQARLRGVPRLQGVYVSARKEILTYKQEVPESLGATLLHEASHAIMDEHFDHVQPWLSEGAAEYFAYALARNPQNTAVLQRRWAFLNAKLREGKLPKLLPLLNADHEEWKGFEPELSYGASWSLFQFLMRSEANKRIVRTLVQEWQSLRQPRVDCAEQMQRLYPGGVKALEKDWHQWIDRADKGNGTAELYQANFQGRGICRFATRGYNLPPGLESTINEQVTKLVAEHQRIFGFEMKTGFFIPVRVFGEFKDYALFTTNALVSGWTMKSEDLAGIAGYYSPFNGEVVVSPGQTPEALAHTVVFLASNVLLKKKFERLPQWVHSGSPNYFAAVTTGGIGERRLAAAWERAGMRATSMPLKTVLDDNSPAWESKGADGRRNEVLSWALTQFLCSKEERQKAFRAVLTELQVTPGVRLNSIPAFGKYYQGGLAQLEIDFRSWASNIGLD